MKPLYLSLVLSFLCHSASAQVLDQLERQVEPVTRELGRVTDEVQETIRQAVEDELIAQRLLETPVANPLLDPLTQTVGTLGNTLGGALPILNRKGDKVFVEVPVESHWRALEREWLMLLDSPGLQALAALGVEIIEKTQFESLGLQLVRFRVPAALDSLGELKKQLPVHLHDQLDRNHIYFPQAVKAQGASNHSALLPVGNSFCATVVKVGIVDTAVNTRHPAFAQSHIEQEDFVGEEFDAPRAHGTAVAGILVGRGEQLTPLLPQARLFAASVFYPRTEYAQGATMMSLVRALNWLLEKNVRVINMSLAGPDNQILALAIQKTIQSGITIVAAAGNEGPAAAPAYPAAYTDVIAVTAVDKNERIYRWANRGDHIDFAAPGVAVFTARSGGDFGNETGTSMAAPLITAAAACGSRVANTSAVVEQLKSRVIDLGAPGRDPVFGEGLLRRP